MQNRFLPLPLLMCAVVMVLLVPILAVPEDEASDGARKRLRLKDNAAAFWIYDDLEQAFAKARESAKPLLVSFRCVP